MADKECKACHGLDGKGAAPGIPNLAGQRGRYIMAALKEYKEGKRVHAALRSIATDLSEDQTRGVAAFYASLPPIPPERGAVFSPYENGKAVAAACAPCHGADGNSKTAGTPNLAGQQPIYFVTATQEYLTGRRESAPMDPMLRKLNKLDIESVALYFASQTPAQRRAPPAGNAAAGRAAHRGMRRLSRLARREHRRGDAEPRRPGSAISGARHQGLPHHAQERHRWRASSPVSAIRRSPISSHSIRRRNRSPRKTDSICCTDITDKCNRCHAGDIDNPALAIPIINAQDKDYLVLALRAYRDGKRGNSLMHNMSVPYGDSIIESIASYYATLKAK